MEYVNLKTCPICGAYPEKEISDMGRPGGHGYPGHYSYHYECPNCKLLKSASFNDVWATSIDAVAQAQKCWNGICDGVQTHLDKLYVKKER